MSQIALSTKGGRANLTHRNVGGSPTLGNHEAETGLGGWACKNRTQKRRGKISL
jgi:hypothetical protein